MSAEETEPKVEDQIVAVAKAPSPMSSPKTKDEAPIEDTRKDTQEGNTSPKNAAWEDQQRVIEELLQTEGSYLADLRRLRQLFLEPLSKDNDLLSREDFSIIFSNVRAIADVHENLFRDLSVAVMACCTQRSTKQLTQVFCNAAEQLGVYSVFCGNSQYSTPALEKCRKKYPKFEKFVAEAEKSGQRLESFLIKPVQRLCRYPLLFTALLGKMPKTDPERADVEKTLEALQQVANDVNEFSRKMESANKIFELTRKLSGLEERLNTHGRLLIAERVVNAVFPGEKREVIHLALFNDMILFARIRNKKKLQFRCKMPFESTSIMVTPQAGATDWPMIFTCNAKGNVSEVTVFEASDRDRNTFLSGLQQHCKPPPTIVNTSGGNSTARRRDRSKSASQIFPPMTARTLSNALPSLMIPEEASEDDASMPPLTRRGAPQAFGFSDFVPPSASATGSPQQSRDPTDYPDALAPKGLSVDLKAARRRSLPADFRASPRLADEQQKKKEAFLQFVISSKKSHAEAPSAPQSNSESAAPLSAKSFGDYGTPSASLSSVDFSVSKFDAAEYSSSSSSASNESDAYDSKPASPKEDLSEVERLRLDVSRLSSKLVDAEKKILELTSALALMDSAMNAVRGYWQHPASATGRM
eukprot:TRINITY_DN3539_c0_g1_i1.p1 TRINITY_DN3539_c0_g1~~TRINITY_DN3539_c0_g1_i1.p1  ORF type:complete len:643 (-),score=123.68 TRINITY_DN3539_c0_g1_i1:91-2019(-)